MLINDKHVTAHLISHWTMAKADAQHWLVFQSPIAAANESVLYWMVQREMSPGQERTFQLVTRAQSCDRTKWHQVTLTSHTHLILAEAGPITHPLLILHHHKTTATPNLVMSTVSTVADFLNIPVLCSVYVENSSILGCHNSCQFSIKKLY